MSMTNEQREAVEKLRERFEPDKFGGICALGYKNKYCFGKSDLQAIDTVLSLIKENSAEIQQKNTELAEKSAELDKKDKQIDLMAKKITMTKPTLCTRTNEFSMGRMYMSKEEIKQYFERKVEDVKD